MVSLQAILLPPRHVVQIEHPWYRSASVRRVVTRMLEEVLASGLLLGWLCQTVAAEQQQFKVINGGFEEGIKGWRTTGEVHLETNHPLAGRASACIGPGAGSVAQRIETGSGNDFTVKATIQAQHTNGWVFAIRFLDQKGREVMRVDSFKDTKPSRDDPRKFSHFMMAHPLTRWIELVFSKSDAGESLTIDDVGLEMTDENAADLKPTCDLNQAMQPFWLNHTVYNEAVLMQSQGGNAATGPLMFEPSRILSVRDYGLVTNYAENTDYTVQGRTLICTATSRMPQVREEGLAKGELNWNALGGVQVMVTYEHAEPWSLPHPMYVGDNLPHTVKKLKARRPLTVVAYGDSITHGVGESRLSHIPPFLPPWPELLVCRLKKIYQDRQIKLYNSAQSGADSSWGREYADRMVASLNPDLVLIAFGQNDFWRIPANSLAHNIAAIVKIVRKRNPNAEFLLISTMRFDPAYTSNAHYWNLVGEYAKELKAMTGPGVQLLDLTSITEALYAAKKPKDFLNDPLHPNDYLARWYAQSAAAALDPAQGTH